MTGTPGWRHCSYCLWKVVPADSGNCCRVCGYPTSELWDKETCARYCQVSVKTWQGYQREGDQNPLAMRPPGKAGYHPVTGAEVWAAAEVVEWERVRPRQGERLDLREKRASRRG